MKGQQLFNKKDYVKKFINTFCPRLLFKCSLKPRQSRKYWSEQNLGTPHGYDNYSSIDKVYKTIENFSRDEFLPRIEVLLPEIQARISHNDSIMDLGCNCGFYLKEIKSAGFTHLSGIDISYYAIEFGKKNFDLSDVNMIEGSFEIVLPRLVAENKFYDLVYSMGATLELIHPSFDIVKYICAITKEYVILGISEWSHAYPRFWEYEFNKHGFLMIKCIRSFNGSQPKTIHPREWDSMMVFKRIL